MKVRNFNKNGEEIKDISKVVLPEEMQKQLIRIYYKPKEKAPSAKDAKQNLQVNYTRKERSHGNQTK